MAGTTITQLQLGDSVTASQNFVLTSASADGTMKLSRGNFGATTQDIITVPVSGTAKIVGANLMAQAVRQAYSAQATGTTTMPIAALPTTSTGNQYMSLAITPTNASSILEIECYLLLSNTAANHISAALFVSGNSNALTAAAEYQASTSGAVQLALKYWMVAGTTSALTFTVNAGGNAAGTTSFNGASGAVLFGGTAPMSSMIIREYLP
jgi:hypothetical protein